MISDFLVVDWMGVSVDTVDGQLLDRAVYSYVIRFIYISQMLPCLALLLLLMLPL